jgi:hypothetical protein
MKSTLWVFLKKRVPSALQGLIPGLIYLSIDAAPQISHRRAPAVGALADQLKSSKSINDAPLVFDGRTLDPLRHILASASRAVLALLRGQIEGHIELDCQGFVLPGGVRNNPLPKVARMVKDLQASGRARLQGDLRATDHEVAVRVI